MSLLHTGTFRIDEFALAGGVYGLVNVALDIECYSDRTWQIARVGLHDEFSERTHWLTETRLEKQLGSVIQELAAILHEDEINRFVASELEAA